VRLAEAVSAGRWRFCANHRLLERFLHEFLGYSWDEVPEEAERLEHLSRSGSKTGLRLNWAIPMSIPMDI